MDNKQLDMFDDFDTQQQADEVIVTKTTEAKDLIAF